MNTTFTAGNAAINTTPTKNAAMNTTPIKTSILRVLALGATGAFLLTQAQAATVVLDDQFSSATIVTPGAANTAYVSSATNWFSFQSSGGGTPVGIGTGTPSPITGNALRFSGSSGNDIVVGGFNPVTLSLAGQYIQVTLNYAYYTTLPEAGGAALLGLFNNNGSAVTANGFANRTELVGDKGYKVEKLTATGTSDLSVYGITEGGSGSSYFGGGGTALTTNSTGVTSALATAYTMTLRLTLASNGTSLLLDSSFGGISTAQQTIASPLTLTFNEMAFKGSGTGGNFYMDNVLVTIPEPATWGLLAFSLTTVMVLRRRRMQG